MCLHRLDNHRRRRYVKTLLAPPNRLAHFPNGFQFDLCQRKSQTINKLNQDLKKKKNTKNK